MSSELQKRVERGISLLNSKRPGWHRQINLETLCLRSCTCCVLGQVLGSRWEELDGFREITPDTYTAIHWPTRRDWLCEHGFWIKDAESGGYEALTDIWILEIAKLQEVV